MRLVLLVVAMGLTACGSSIVADNGSSSSASTSASASTTGSTGSTGGGGAGLGEGGCDLDPDLEDHLTLENCGSESCPTGAAQRIEGGVRGAMYGMECIVTAMRDRTSGLYRVELNHTFSNGGTTATHTIFITPSGEVEVGKRVETLDEFHGASSTDYEATERCSLKPTSFFEVCLAAVSTGEFPSTEAWDCVYPNVSSFALPWFESCVEQSPTCE